MPKKNSFNLYLKLLKLSDHKFSVNVQILPRIINRIVYCV